MIGQCLLDQLQSNLAFGGKSYLRWQGAIYSSTGGGAGGIYRSLPVVTLAERISSFRDLPVLLAEAQALGTNILYLICPGSGNQSSFQRPAAFGQNVVHTWLSNPYMRVSSESDRQITDLQRDALLAAGVDGRHLVAFRPDWIRALIPRNIDASSRILVLRRY